MRKIMLLLVFVFSAVVSSSAQELRDIKAPIVPPDQPVWPFITGVLVIALLLGFRLRRRKSGNKAQGIELTDPFDIAKRDLQSLMKTPLSTADDFDHFYVGISDIMRRYIEERFNVKASEMTTEEFLDSLKKADFLGASQKNTLKEFLVSCDLVKFAKYAPNEDEARISFEMANRFLDETRVSESVEPEKPAEA